MNTSTLLLMLVPFIAIQVGLQIYALVDMYRRKGAKPPIPSWGWVLIIVLGELVGVLLYFAIGRTADSGEDQDD